jgi:hypothetical protein
MDVMEASMLELEMDAQNPKISREFEMIGSETRQTLALLSTTDTREAWNLLSRYQAAARRSYNSAFKALRDLQGDRFNRQPAILPAAEVPGCKEAAPTAPDSQTNPPPPAPSVSTPLSPVSFLFRRRHLENTEIPTEPEIAMTAGRPVAVAA